MYLLVYVDEVAIPPQYLLHRSWHEACALLHSSGESLGAQSPLAPGAQPELSDSTMNYNKLKGSRKEIVSSTRLQQKTLLRAQNNQVSSFFLGGGPRKQRLPLVKS